MKTGPKTAVVATLLLTGVLAGYYLGKTDSHEQADAVSQAATTKQAPLQDDSGAATPSAPTDDPVRDRLEHIETQLARLQSRMEQLESHRPISSDIPERHLSRQQPDTTVDFPVEAPARLLSVDSLTRAGLDPDTAMDIVRRKNRLELKKLELRDRASRQAYLGSERYMQELRELTSSDISLREELGDDTYDRYLYASGQTNRVRVAAVMLGSAAEQAGLLQGDIIVAYNGQRLFDWRALQQATTEGNRDEYVSLTVERNGQQLLLWVPRGPLGIRLTTTRINPDA